MNTGRMGNTGASLHPPDNSHSDEVVLQPSISLMLSANENEYIEGKLSTSDQKNTSVFTNTRTCIPQVSQVFP